jgi:hypothetical protein
VLRRVYLDGGQEPRQVGYQPPRQSQFVRPEKVTDAVRPDSVQSRVTRQHFQHAPRRRVLFEHVPDVFSYIAQYHFCSIPFYRFPFMGGSAGFVRNRFQHSPEEVLRAAFGGRRTRLLPPASLEQTFCLIIPYLTNYWEKLTEKINNLSLPTVCRPVNFEVPCSIV